MRKRFLALLLAGAVALGLCGCTPVEEDSGKLSVVCSLFPYYDFVRVIGGEWVEPRLLVAAGREAHSFEPTPADVIRVSRADVFVYNGGEAELRISSTHCSPSPRMYSSTTAARGSNGWTRS